ncbi:hypothetical protein SaSA201_0552 [Streptococcus agalactiae]|nr:hypothetical protein SaSA30_0553 [Streptococcus agalactiae]AUO81739.1 hypothetical protein SaSA33_0552 [Streptococcus agalactiae]AUO83354.1 hypothetical protein SaSA53_0547 [Streptococcus agalactiae]AUO85023.1 hypothetical protein SaSA73_0549 [Streptococcus agalactiae]AUO86633.1 hypothetical protein SaSA1_0554 [Streptococcus agalactiae]
MYRMTSSLYMDLLNRILKWIMKNIILFITLIHKIGVIFVLVIDRRTS